MKAASAIATNPDWEKTLLEVLSRTTSEMRGVTVDLALLFVTPAFRDHYGEIVKRVRTGTQAKLLVGCSGYGVIGQGQELEAQPAISLLLLSLPETKLTTFPFTQAAIEEATEPAYWHQETEVLPEDVNFWMLFADPFQMDSDALLQQLNEAYPEIPIVGGLASGEYSERATHVFFNDEVLDHGGIGIAVGGATTLRAVVAQGCQPIGEPHIITGVERNVIQMLSSQPAYEVLATTYQGLTPELRERANQNLFVGLVMNEYQEDFQRGDFLIRNIMGFDPDSGAVAVGALPRLGQTMQFQLRDADAADEDLRELLDREKKAAAKLGQPLAALLCCCNGRGQNLFGKAHHDAAVIGEKLGPLPLAGFFCNGEIGPVGDRNFLHGYTASLAMLVMKPRLPQKEIRKKSI